MTVWGLNLFGALKPHMVHASAQRNIHVKLEEAEPQKPIDTNIGSFMRKNSPTYGSSSKMSIKSMV